MSNFKDFISSGGGGGADKLNLQSPTSGLKVIVGGSMTYTPSIDCTVVVTCIGAGGGGGSTYTVSDRYNICTGGGAGGLCQSELNLTSGTAYTITLGAGGTSGNNYTAGGLGGNTTFTGSDITDVTANGGAGGLSARASNSVNVSAGGTATGGNIANHTGGSSSTNTSSGSTGATGGGAVGFFGTGQSTLMGSGSGNGRDGAGQLLAPTDLIPLLDPNVSGGVGVSGADGGFGCGGSAYDRTNDPYGSGSYTKYGGNGGTGAGGGGGYGYNNSSGNGFGYGGVGGAGKVILEFV